MPGLFQPLVRAPHPGAARRMLCLHCGHQAEPDTALEGSDRVELLAWSAGVLPGAIYCTWRHLCRAKRCEQCGSGDLMREALASARRRTGLAPRAAGPRIVLERGAPFPWPPALRTPRGRLRRGVPAAAAMGVAWLLVGLSLLVPLHASVLECAAGLACGAALWCAWQLQPMAWQRDPFDACAAWDLQGRRIRIERA